MVRGHHSVRTVLRNVENHCSRGNIKGVNSECSVQSYCSEETGQTKTSRAELYSNSVTSSRKS